MKNCNVTEIGKYLRKLRIENDETGKIMAIKLGITSAYLSAIELGKRKITDEVRDEIIWTYGLNDEQIIELKRMIWESSDSLKLDLRGLNSSEKMLLYNLYNNPIYITDSELQELRNVLKKMKESDQNGKRKERSNA